MTIAYRLLCLCSNLLRRLARTQIRSRCRCQSIHFVSGLQRSYRFRFRLRLCCLNLLHLFLNLLQKVCSLLLFLLCIFLATFTSIGLLCVELFKWIVHLKYVHTDELELAVTKVVSSHRLVHLSLLLEHLLLDIVHVLSCFFIGSSCNFKHSA